MPVEDLVRELMPEHGLKLIEALFGVDEIDKIRVHGTVLRFYSRR